MEAEVFVRTRPCLEEIEGWLLGREIQKLPMTPEVLGPIETYKARVMRGKELPAPSTLPRDWVYQQGRKPVFKPPKGPAPEPKGKAPFRADRNSRKKR